MVIASYLVIHARGVGGWVGWGAGNYTRCARCVSKLRLLSSFASLLLYELDL